MRDRIRSRTASFFIFPIYFLHDARSGRTSRTVLGLRDEKGSDMKQGWRTGMASLALGLTLLAPLSLPHGSGSAHAQEQIARQTGQALTPRDIIALHDTREIALSPDGRSILFTVQDRMSTFTPDGSEIWQVAADGKSPARRFISSKGFSHSPQWSRDGRAIAFLSGRPNPLSDPARGLAFRTEPQLDAEPPAPSAMQLWRIAPDGGEAVPLTAMPGGVTAFQWSPDGRQIAFLAMDPPNAQERAERDAKKDWIEVDHHKHYSRLWLLDIDSGVARRLSPGDMNVSEISWSPDGKMLALKVAPTPSINDFFYHSRIVLLPVQGGAVRETAMASVASGARWSKDGKSIAYVEILKDGAEKPLKGGISTALRIFDTTTGTVKRIGDAYPGLLSEPEWTANGQLVALSFEKTRSRLVRIDPRSGAITPTADFDGEASNLTLSEDGRVTALTGNMPDRPSDVFVLTGKTFTPITRINPQVADWKLGKVEQISWKSSIDGRDIYGVLVTPPGYRPGTPLRMVTQIHGGPEWAWWAGWLGSWHDWAQMLATHGFAVFLPNPRGSDGQGAEFARAVRGDWGGADFQDINDGIDMLVARKIADPARLGIGGWSYGGFMSGWAVTHSDRFRTAVMGAAVTDLLAMARTTDTPDFPWDYYGDVPANIAKYDAASSVRLLDRVKVPVLLLHGEGDTRVPIEQGEHFYVGLRMLDKPAEMVRYPREPHWFGEREHQIDVQQRVLDWFEAHL